VELLWKINSDLLLKTYYLNGIPKQSQPDDGKTISQMNKCILVSAQNLF
jgi:hypothetical protein